MIKRLLNSIKADVLFFWDLAKKHGFGGYVCVIIYFVFVVLGILEGIALGYLVADWLSGIVN